MLTTLERNHLTTQFPELEPESVTKRLGMGIEKVTFAFRAGVMKLLRKDTQSDVMSRFVSPLFTTPVDDMKRDTDMSVEYFGEETVLVPQIIRASQSDAYALLQDKLSEIQILTPDLCIAHPELLEQLKDLLERNQKLKTDRNRFFDFQGWDLWRIITNQIAMGNLAVVWDAERKNPKLKMFDLTLMHTPGFSANGIIHAPGYLSNERNNHRMVTTAEHALTA
ncbi:MAG TPA: hypothetical protein PKV72_05395 [Candidatus Peribacteria bacterium]|nr:hypothetical protein [Candidatus Peribacteria bacterium]